MDFIESSKIKGFQQLLAGGHRLILFVYLYLVRINLKTKFCSIWSQNPRIFPYYKCNFNLCSNVYDDVTDFEICGFHKNINKTLFFPQIKKFINYTSRAALWQKNSFVAEITFNLEVEKNISGICTSKVSYKTSSFIFWWINCPER